MADNYMATKYDLVQKERVCDDIWLCTTRPSEICYKPCKVHNPAACDGAGLPGVEWDDDDVFEDEEVETDQSEDMTDTSFSDNEVWDSDVDVLDDPIATAEEQRVNHEMDKWMQVADMFYSQAESAPSMPVSYGVVPPPANAHFQGYFPWNAIYPSAGVPGGFAYPMMPMSFPYPGAIPNAYVPTTQQDLANVNNMLINNPWPLISREHQHSAPTVHQQHQGSSRGWDELVDEQERYQQEMAAAMVAQCVGATEECETSTDSSYIASTPAPGRFASPPAPGRFASHPQNAQFASHPQNAVYSTDFWRQSQVDQPCS